MNKDQILEELKQSKEMIPDEHDGSYELMREIVSSYAKMDSLDDCGVTDLNAVYAMAIGTWKMNVEKKKEYVEKSSLPDDEISRLAAVLDKVWDNACQRKYENRENENKPSVGMFGTGFYSFARDVSDEDAQAFIEMLVNILDVKDDDEMFDIAATVLDKPFKGMQAASASVMLHCLKPMTFPIINSNAGHGTIYSALGIELDKPKENTTYISNCRKIKEFRDSNLPFKNYRILDRKAWEIEGDEEISEKEEQMGNKKFEHNIILYGPPGTGKTYNTMAYAVAIIEGKSLDEVKDEADKDYSAVKTRYEEYKKADQIAFTTFHQSYGYEEFIEGIKPNVTDEEGDNAIEFVKEPGIFKAFCEKALMPSIEEEEDYGLNKSPAVWKVSLGHTYDNPTRTECMENDHIRIGWDDYGEELPERDDNYSGKAVLNSFYNKMRIGDIVLSCYTASTIDAIGVITGECEWHPEYDVHKRLRKVRWLVKGLNEDIVDLNNGTTMTLSTVYKMKIPASSVLELVNKNSNTVAEGVDEKSHKKKFVFIIDEINRGNISKIFGELITLIETTKRKGAEEEASAILPYTQEKFSVPENVYILGTMNTADRSIALMDTALRRRFAFEEMMPEPNVLRKISANIVSEGDETLDVAKMLEIINRRIEYLYDREHTIGHAFFTCLKDEPTIDKLASVFEKSVIPLLQEYFYEDYGKIQLVLGDNGKTGENKQFQFIRDDKINVTDVFSGNPEVDIPENKYSIQKSAFRRIESYKLIGKGL
ncbi:AAA family ATPase [Butyrivibrio sp. VCD2006]|uniref:AAA family ATPase n=1 Tax=Butyrivibrio sp. VCD2006 TaxID=1280664 RepID=UPI000407AB81|nr:AAA family ATPase [Butyrivibrio sp. VCD2006]